MATFEVTATASAENTFTNAIEIQGYFNLSINGVSDSTVTVQRKSGVDGTNWVDVESYTADKETYGFEPEPVEYRVGIKTGNYGTDTVKVRLGRQGRNRFETFPS